MAFSKWSVACLVRVALPWCCFAIFASVVADEVRTQRPTLIDFRDPVSIESHCPIIIAHRGGVVSDDAPECSLTAIRRAASAGFDMVELDVQSSRDGLPVLFHDRTLAKACGRAGRVADYSLSELESFSYKGSQDKIIGLDAAFRVCRELRLGVMLDLKAGRESPEFLLRLKRLLTKHGLLHAAITFSGTKQAREVLTGVRFTPTDDELQRLRADQGLDLSGRFWFGLPKQLADNDVQRLRAAKALVLPAINTFRYAAKNHMVSAQKDIRQLTQLGVDGFQIDSIYMHLVKSADNPED